VHDRPPFSALRVSLSKLNFYLLICGVTFCNDRVSVGGRSGGLSGGRDVDLCGSWGEDAERMCFGVEDVLVERHYGWV